MIANYDDYKDYVRKEGDEIAINIFIFRYLKTYIDFQPTKRFLLLLRTCEYFKNCKKGRINYLVYLLVKYQKYKLGLKLNFTIPENVAKKGLQLPHYGTIVINSKVRIGENCRIHVCTNIGSSSGNKTAPIIGDNVYIGPGVKIYGDIRLANNISIAANSCVFKSFSEEGIIIGGVPAKLIKIKKK